MCELPVDTLTKYFMDYRCPLKLETLLSTTSTSVKQTHSIEMFVFTRIGLDLVVPWPISNAGSTPTAELCAVNVGAGFFFLYP